MTIEIMAIRKFEARKTGESNKDFFSVALVSLW